VCLCFIFEHVGLYVCDIDCKETDIMVILVIIFILCVHIIAIIVDIISY
jgi:hypothetical protein